MRLQFLLFMFILHVTAQILGLFFSDLAGIMKVQLIAVSIKEGGVFMEIGSLADIALSQMPALSTTKPSDISIAMLSKQLDMTQEMGADMIKAMEQSVTPHIGGNIDVYA